MALTHRYAAATSWRGSTAVGYGAYDRTHRASAPPAAVGLELSADPAFHGDPAQLNPEQLVVLAASSCQLLSFLAVAARARVDVVSYDDDAEAEMPEDDPPVRLTRITLRPRIGVVEGPSAAKVERLVRLAHETCYVASSLRTEVVVVPELTFLPAPGAGRTPPG